MTIRKNMKGFTLIELLVVTAVIATAVEKDHETVRPAKAEKDELSEKELDKASGGTGHATYNIGRAVAS